MSKRITDLTRAESIMTDDFMMVDSPTGGSRKYPVNTLIAAAAAAQSPLLDDWSQAAAYIAAGLGEVYFPVASRVTEAWSTAASSGASAVSYDAVLNVVNHAAGALADGDGTPVVEFQFDKCLPFDTPFSAQQAFLYAIDGLPAGTYNVTMGFSWGGNVVSGKTYQFTLTQALPAGGQLAGFRGAPDVAPENWRVYAYASPAATAETETCVVTEGSGGTSLGTFTAAGVAVPASGTPETSSTVTVSGTSYRFYGLNSLHRVAYGNNRWLHSAIRQYLNSSGFNWYKAQTVFDRPPSYVGRNGFLSGFSEEFLAHVLPIERKTAINYVTDGGTSASPLYDTTYDRFVLPSGKEHYLEPTAYYGGAEGLEGDYWPFWQRVAGTAAPLGWSTWGNESTYHPEYVQYDIASPTAARSVWLRSAYRGAGGGVGVVFSAGGCGSSTASGGCRVAPACAIG